MAYSNQKENKTQVYPEKGEESAFSQMTDKNDRSSGSSSEGDKEEKGDSPTARRGGVVMRKSRQKKDTNKLVFSRRVTIHELGEGTCEGWLLKKSENKTYLSKSWVKMFFKLKEFVLYYYKDEKAEKATGVICLAGYTVQHSHKRKWAMKISHKGIDKKLYIAAQRQSDWETWLEHLQLAAIVYANTDNVRNSRTFTDKFGDSPPVMDDYSGYHSESDDDMDENGGLTRENIFETVTKLSALRRTIEAKRRALNELDKLLAQKITSESIKLWQRNHPDLLQGILTNHSGDVKRNCSSSDEVKGSIASDNSQLGATARPSPSVRLRRGGTSLSVGAWHERHERQNAIRKRIQSRERTQSETSDIDTQDRDGIMCHHDVIE